MGLLSAVKNLLSKSSSRLPQAVRIADVACLIDNSTGDVRPVLVTGSPGSGKSTFVTAVSRRFTDCVIHLHRSHGRVAGFEEAPLMGSWLAQGAEQTEDADLEDILRMRPEGLFTLEMPSQFDTAVDLNDLLNSTLMSSVLHWEAAKHRRPLRTLTLIIEEGLTWMPDNVLQRLLATGRAWQLRVVLVEQQAEQEHLWANLGHLVAFKSHSQDYCERLGEWLGVPVDQLRSLPAGQGFYRSAHWHQTGLEAQRFNCPPPTVALPT